jgi:hypothetical protein
MNRQDWLEHRAVRRHHVAADLLDEEHDRGIPVLDLLVVVADLVDSV